MAQLYRLAAIILSFLLLTGCASGAAPKEKPAQETGEEARGESTGRLSAWSTVYRLDGEPFHMSSLMQDKVEQHVNNGKVQLKIRKTEYLLLIVSHTECEWTQRLLSETVEAIAEFNELKVRVVLILRKKGETEAKEWENFDIEGLAVLEDRNGPAYAYYVKLQTPSISIIKSDGNRIFTCEGYVAPKTLAEKLENGDFSSVSAAPG